LSFSASCQNSGVDFPLSKRKRKIAWQLTPSKREGDFIKKKENEKVKKPLCPQRLYSFRSIFSRLRKKRFLRGCRWKIGELLFYIKTFLIDI